MVSRMQACAHMSGKIQEFMILHLKIAERLFIIKLDSKMHQTEMLAYLLDITCGLLLPKSLLACEVQ